MKPVLIALALLALSGCAQKEAASERQPSPPPMVGIANPAAVDCVQKGGRVEIIKDAGDNEAGYCHLPDGRVCEEWALFRDKACTPPKP